MHSLFFTLNKHFKNKAYNQIYKEIYFRVRYVLLCFILSGISCFLYAQQFLYLYLSPLYNLSQNVIFTGIPEAFYTSIHICVLYAFASSVPFCVYVFLCFFLPSLFPLEKKKLYIICFFLNSVYVLGLYLCSTYIIPELCILFLKYGDMCYSSHGLPVNDIYLSLQAKVSSYVSWSYKIYVLSVVILQIPILLTVLFYKYQPFLYMEVLPFRKYASIFILLFCACVSPPDIYSQGGLYFFFMGIFELILWFTLYEQVLKQKKTI